MGDGLGGKATPKKDGVKPKRPLIGLHRSVEEITRSAEQSVEEYRRSEEVQDWMEEKRFDDDTRGGQSFRDWARRDPAVYEAWSNRRARLAGEVRQFLQERQTDKIDSIRSQLSWEPHEPVFEQNTKLVSLCAGLNSGLIGHFQTLLHIDSVPLRALDALRLDIHRRAHDMPLLLDAIVQPIANVWGINVWGGRIDISPRIDFEKENFTNIQLAALEPLVAASSYNPDGPVPRFVWGRSAPGEFLLMAAYRRLADAVDRYHALVSLNVPRDPAEAIELLKGDFRLPDVDEFKTVGDDLLEELKRTLTVHDVVWEAFEESFGNDPKIMELPFVRYIEAGASVFLCGFGREIGQQIANRFAEPRYSAVYDLLFEDPRVFNLGQDFNKYLEGFRSAKGPSALVDELKQRIENLPKSKEFKGSKLALKAAYEKAENLRSAVGQFDAFFGSSRPEPQLLMPAALELIFEVRRFRDLFSQSSRNFVELEYLMLPLEGLMEFCRLRMLDAAGVDR